MKEFTIYDMLYPKYKITKPIRLIEFFAGYGSQALALKYLGINFEHYKISEWAIKSIQAYKDLHFTDIEKDYTQDMTKQDLIDYFKEHNISSNYNDPLNEEQIKRLNENQLRKIYNNMKITNNLGSIVNIKGKDLEIVDTDKYCYIMTYSFPCQDLSNAGKKGGMSDTSTRSGMLWEVERILDECNQIKQLPQILLMENVPQVHSEDVLKDFNKWKYKLEELGYKNYFQDLIATDYGIPQTRNRCFMVSILGNYSYTFPSPIPLELKLKDLLEEKVDEKYFLSDIQINSLENGKYQSSKVSKKIKITNSGVSPTLTTMAGGNLQPFVQVNDDYIQWQQKGHLDIDCRAYFLDKKSPTLTTTPKAKVLLQEKPLINKISNELILNNKVKENDTLLTNFISRRIKENDIIQNNNITPTLTTSATEIGVCVNEKSKDTLFIKNATAKGYIEATDGDGIDVSFPNADRRGRVQKEKIQTITTDGNAHGVVSNDLRIRRLTAKECFRLMGVKDEDYEKVAKNQSNSSLYHLAGDSIVVDVIKAVFKELI